MERRSFFQSLLALTPQARPERKNRRARHKNAQLYRGPLEIPAEVGAIIEASALPPLKTTHRHLCLRAVHADIVYLFRSAPSRFMVGEVIQREDGGYRVHAWATANSGRPVAEIIARWTNRNAPPAPPMPPAAAPTPEPAQEYRYGGTVMCPACGTEYIRWQPTSQCPCRAIAKAPLEALED